MTLLSVLVATIPQRLPDRFVALMERLGRLSEGFSVELLGFYDNRKRSVGAKRNGLLHLARGHFVTFIDDDDDVADEYFTLVLRAIRDNLGADVICFRQECTIDNGPPILCHYSLKHVSRAQTGQQWTGPPAHTMVWRRAVIADVRFPELDFGEDSEWVDRARMNAKTEIQIDRTLYYYRFRSDVTGTRG